MKIPGAITICMIACMTVSVSILHVTPAFAQNVTPAFAQNVTPAFAQNVAPDAEQGSMSMRAMIAWLKEIGADMTWEAEGAFPNRDRNAGQEENPKTAILENVKISRYGRRIEIDQLRMTDNHAVILENMRVFNTRGGDGRIAVDRLEMSEPQVFMDIFEHVNAIPHPPEDGTVMELSDIPAAHFELPCGGLETDGAMSRNWTARGLSLTGDMDALPESVRKPEEIRIGVLRETRKAIRTGPECRFDIVLSFFNAEIMAIDGARGTIVSGSLAIGSEDGLIPEHIDDSRTSRIVVRLEGLRLANSNRIVSASLGRLDFSSFTDGHMDILLCNLLWNRDDLTSTEFLERALETGSSGRFAITNAWLSIPGFLPAGMIRAMGLENHESMVGQMEFEAKIRNGHAMLDSEIDFRGFAKGHLSAGIGLSQSSDVAFSGLIVDRFPVPEELLNMDVHHLSFSFDDQGAGGIVSALTGMRPDEHVGTSLELLQARVADRLPGFVAGRLDRAREVLVNIIARGGQIDIIPESPRTILAMAMQGMMHPGGFSKDMGVRIDFFDIPSDD